MRVRACLYQAVQTQEIAATKKTCFILFFPKLSQAFCGFSYPRLGAICSEGIRAGMLFASPGSHMASLVPEITTHKLYSFKHCLAHYL